jgi:hypothetical protein
VPAVGYGSGDGEVIAAILAELLTAEDAEIAEKTDFSADVADKRR